MGAVHCEVEVEGALDPGRWDAWLGGMRVTMTPAGRTLIAGPVADQTALHGLLARGRDLGLGIYALRRVEESGRGHSACGLGNQR